MNYVNIDGVWRTENQRYTNINGVWRTGSETYVNINGVWRTSKPYPDTGVFQMDTSRSSTLANSTKTGNTWNLRFLSTADTSSSYNFPTLHINLDIFPVGSVKVGDVFETSMRMTAISTSVAENRYVDGTFAYVREGSYGYYGSVSLTKMTNVNVAYTSTFTITSPPTSTTQRVALILRSYNQSGLGMGLNNYVDIQVDYIKINGVYI